MKRLSSAKRVARRIGGDDDEASSEPQSSGNQDNVVKRPALASKASKSRLSTSRLSLGGTSASEDGAPEDVSDAPPPKSLPRKAAGLSRLAMERSAARQQDASDSIPLRPSYSAIDLAALKSDNISTPAELLVGSSTHSGKDSQALDVVAKFGPLALVDQPSAIPSEAEIREKKERRARLALEHKADTGDDYISLVDMGSQQYEQTARRTYRQPSEEHDELTGRLITRKPLVTDKPDRLAETRLARDDEDIAEGFGDYTEDAPLALGKKGRKDAERKRRREIAEAIAMAEGGGATVVMDDDGQIIDTVALAGDDDQDTSEAERNAAFEAAQRRAAGAFTNNSDTTNHSHIPSKITPIPTLSSVLSRLRAQLAERQATESAARYRLTQIQMEKKEIAAQEVFIQQQLKEVGERYEKLRAEAGMTGEVIDTSIEALSTPGRSGLGTPRLIQERGLDSIGGTPVAVRSVD